MKRIFRYVAAIPAVLVLFLTSCVGNRERVISRAELAEIYAEMMIIDQWILNTPNVRLIADTSQVYGPILEKYGFDADACRIAQKYIDLVDKIFDETGNLWEKYNVTDGSIDVVDEYKMPTMMGWSAGVYLAASELLKNKASF